KSGGKDYYYFDESGVMQTGWQNVKGSVYYFGKDGKAAVKTTVIGNYTYKFSAEGKWDGKVYSKDGKKDVTSSVDVAKLVPVATADRSSEYGKVRTIEGKKPATVMINGLTYRTDVDNQNYHSDGTRGEFVFPDGNKYTSAYINIANCTDEDLECLKYMTNMEKLILIAVDNSQMTDKQKELNALYMTNIRLESKITNLDFVYYMPNLKYFTIYNAPYLTDVSGLSVCKNLEEVAFYKSGLKSLDGMENLTKIKKFTAGFTRIENLNGLKNCKNLTTVHMYNSYLTDISGLSNKSKLQKVILNINRRLTDITALGTCKNLTNVTLCECNSIMDWSPLLELTKLKNVCMYGSSKRSNVKDVYEKLKSKGIQHGVFDALYYDFSEEKLPHDVVYASWDKYWDKEKVTSDVYETVSQCTCSYCSTMDNIGNWTGNKDSLKSIAMLGTYK
ncbi:MAG: hypothetical protein NC085_09165, partial [Muribaculaceae bacterium]|nr:hypothetical protein [Muribaculaceae bacterium]